MTKKNHSGLIDEKLQNYSKGKKNFLRTVLNVAKALG